MGNFKDKITSGVTVLSIGLALLFFTFISAYLFLNESLQIITSQDLAQTFGVALAPLIAASIRVMYLGVMGWVGSIITIRGVTIMSNSAKSTLPIQPNLQPQMVKNRALQQSEMVVTPLVEVEGTQLQNKRETRESP